MFNHCYFKYGSITPIPLGTQLTLAAIFSTWPFYWNNKELTIRMDLH